MKIVRARSRVILLYLMKCCCVAILIIHIMSIYIERLLYRYNNIVLYIIEILIASTNPSCLFLS